MPDGLGPGEGVIPIGGWDPQRDRLIGGDEGQGVTEICRDWRVVRRHDGVVGTRHYVSGGSDRLPAIGDPLSEDYPGVTLREIVRTKLGDDSRVDDYILTYTDAPIPTEWLTGGTDDIVSGFFGGYPCSIDVGGHMESVQKDTGWTWEDSEADVKQLLYKRVATLTISVMRTIGALEGFVAQCAADAGHVNAEVISGFPIGTVLFTGAQVTEVRNANGKKRWSAQLKFSILTQLDDTGVERGWQWIRREADGKLARPVKTKDLDGGDLGPITNWSYIYPEASLYSDLLVQSFSTED